MVRYRKAEMNDVRFSDHAPGRLGSRLATSFAVLGCGVFGLVYFVTKSLAIAGMVSGILHLLSLYSILGHYQRMKALEGRLSESEPIEVSEYRPLRVLEIGFSGSTGPALCFELEQGEMLLLRGQWLLESRLYRAPRPIDDGNQNHFNLAEASFAFPARHFALHRWRGDVTPFWIEVLGPYLAPESSSAELPVHLKIRDVEIFSATVDSLQRDFESAFQTAKG